MVIAHIWAVISHTSTTQIRQIADLKKRESDLKAAKAGQADKTEELHDAIDTASKEANAVRRQIQRLEQQKASFTSSDSNSRLSVFGPRVPDILKDIGRERFDGPVLGPLGKYLKMKASVKEYALPVQKIAGALLSSFIVTNQRDVNKLRGILRKHGADGYHRIVNKPQTDRKHNVQAIPRALTALSALMDVDEYLVFNTLVDQCGMHDTVVCKDEAECGRLYEIGEQKNRSFRDGIKSAVTMDCTTLKYKNGNQSDESNKRKFNVIIGSDEAEMIADVQREIAEQQQTLAELQQREKQARQELSGLSSADNDHERTVKQIRLDIRKLEAQRSTIRGRLEELAEAEAVDTSALEDEVAELETAIGTMTAQLDDRQTAIEVAVALVKSHETEKKAIDKHLVALQQKKEAEEEIMQNFINNRVDAQRRLEKGKVALEKKTKKIEGMKQQVEETRQNVDTMTAKAQTDTAAIIEEYDGNPLELKRKETKDVLKKKEKDLKAEFERAKNDAKLKGKTKALVLQRYEAAKADFLESRREYESVTKNLEALQADYKLRGEGWKEQRAALSKRVKKKFNLYLQGKSFGGTVHFKHKEGELDIECQTDNRDERTKAKDVRQLSGGERSFTTLCLLLALGSVVSFRVAYCIVRLCVFLHV
jgi:structural maintenance of chromosomes protein 6